MVGNKQRSKFKKLSQDFKDKDLDEKYDIQQKIAQKHAQTNQRILKIFIYSFIGIAAVVVIYSIMYILSFFNIINISFDYISGLFNFITLTIAIISLVISGFSLYSISDFVNNLKSDIQHEELITKIDNLENKFNQMNKQTKSKEKEL